AAEPAALVDGAGEAAVAAPAPQRDARPAPQAPGQRVRRRVVVHDDDLDLTAAGTRRSQDLPDQGRRVFPLAVVDDHHRKSRGRDGAPGATPSAKATDGGRLRLGRDRAGHGVPSPAVVGELLMRRGAEYKRQTPPGAMPVWSFAARHGTTV